MPYTPGAVKTAWQNSYAAQIATLMANPPVTPVQLQQALAQACEDAFVAGIALLGVINPAGLVAPPSGGAVTGATANGSIG